MASGEIPQRKIDRRVVESRRSTGAFVTIFVFLAFLLTSNLYTVGQLDSSRRSLEGLQRDFESQIKDVRNADRQLASKFSLLEERHAHQIDALRRELDLAAQRLGSKTGQVLDRARTMAAHLQSDQRRQVNSLQQQISQKADTEEVDSLSEDVSATKADVGSAQRTLSVLAGDLATARSELGTVTATDRNDIEVLRHDRDRQYYEFVLTKNARLNIAGIGLILRKTYAEQHRFGLDLIVNDQQIRNEKQNVGQPIVFYVEGFHSPCEVVVSELGYGTAKGFLSIPKGFSPLIGTHLTQGPPLGGITY